MPERQKTAALSNSVPIKLTDLTIQKLKRDRRYSVWCDDVPTFGVRVNQKSTTFVIKQANRYHVFGRYPIVSLKQAREEAKRRLALKYFPQQSIKAQEAIALYLGAKRSELRPSSLKNFTGALRQFPAKNLGEVTTLDIAQALRPLPPSNANLCQAIFKAFLNWCVDKGHISSNPIAAQKRPHKTKSRDRASHR